MAVNGTTIQGGWLARVASRTLPPDAHGARAFAGRIEQAEEQRAEAIEQRTTLRVDADGNAVRTIGDLRQLWARHGDLH